MRRTLYLSMVCLLSALSVAGQTGLRDLNPIEKQKLQLPELPSSQARARCFDPMEAWITRKVPLS